ncbi:MAG: DUF4367 domain-containing protein [Clostridiaceae bacterium]|nr:DUF4367 domain-containing protein [Clostridiaceae bacterium]
MTDQELDQLMKQILLDAVKLDMEELDKTDAVFTPSARYRRQMAAMQRNPLKWMRQKARPLWKRILRQAAMLFLVLSAGFGCVMVTVPSARGAAVRWMLEWYDSYAEYRYSGKITSELPVYVPTCLPEGFEETIKDDFSSSISSVYEDSDGNVIYFDYWFMFDGTVFSIFTENQKVINITVNNHEGLYFESPNPEGNNTITWIDEEAGIQFQIDARMDLTSILHIAEGVELVKVDK